MMKSLPALLILLMLLSACTAVPPGEEPIRETAASQLPDPGGGGLSPEGTSRDGIYGYPLGEWDAVRLFPMGEGLLLIRLTGDSTFLTLIEGSEAAVTAEATLSFPLEPENGSLALWEQGVSCFDPVRQETIVLDEALREVFRIPAPGDLVGWPLLSRDGAELYYCTPDAVRVLERSGGVSRILKQTDCSGLRLTGLWLRERYLSCEAVDESEELSFLMATDTGETAYVGKGSILAAGDVFFAAEPGCGVIGQPEGNQQALYPRHPCATLCFLPENRAAVSLAPEKEGMAILEYYDLVTGLRTGAVSVPQTFGLSGDFAGMSGNVWFLGIAESGKGTALYRWAPEETPTGDPAVYTDRYFREDAPDHEGITRCEAYARELEERYGLEIQLFQMADGLLPEGYLLEWECHVPVLMRNLQLLEHCLSQYPPGFTQTVKQCFEGLTVCLVRSIRETETGNLRDGLQFWEGNHAMIALAAGGGAEGAFYHQFCHLVDTVVLNGSSAYDMWSSYNPTGFRYDYSYTANRGRNSTVYLQAANRSFVDMFSMSYPREDRARIMEYAMLPGNEALFQSPAMQQKLRALCLGIREAFGLAKSEDTFLWEQYLGKSVAAK